MLGASLLPTHSSANIPAIVSIPDAINTLPSVSDDSRTHRDSSHNMGVVEPDLLRIVIGMGEWVAGLDLNFFLMAHRIGFPSVVIRRKLSINCIHGSYQMDIGLIYTQLRQQRNYVRLRLSFF